MAIRRKMKERYRRFPYLSDFAGMKSAIGEMRGLGALRQPSLNNTILIVKIVTLNNPGETDDKC